MNSSNIKTPYFERQIVDPNREDGYWIEAVNIDKNNLNPDIIGYGLNKGDVNWYRNPDWIKTNIAKLDGPVGMHFEDINHNGLEDIVICYDYGKTMVECNPNGGKIIWLENPGDINKEWNKHYIGKITAMHRLKIGHFTQTDRLEVLALPIVGKPFDAHSVVPVKLFTQPDDVYKAKNWEDTLINNSFYHVIHGVSMKKYQSKNNITLDSVLLATEEGISWLYYDIELKKWTIENIGIGELSQEYKTGFKGSGDVDAGKIGDDNFAYIPAVEPFHGNTISVYIKDTDNVLTDLKWKRIVLDVYDNPNELGEGPAHFVVCADFDNDGDDEFLVALRGPMPWQGIYYYKAIDVKKGIFTKWKVSSDSAARIAVADFDGDGKLDFATIGYSVEGYYKTENPQIIVFYNRF